MPIDAGFVAVDWATTVNPGNESEYGSIYRDFAEHLRSRRSAVDREPLRLLAHSFLVARRGS